MTLLALVFLASSTKKIRTNKDNIIKQNNNTMQFILTCPNGNQIDMTNDILRQIDGQITRKDVEERIEFYNLTNKK